MKKQAIITGAAGGLGTAVTQKFLEAGYEVTALTQPGHPDQIDHLKSATGSPAELRIQPLDVMDGKAVAGFFANQENIHAAIFLVGGFAMGKLADTSEADLDKMLSLNFKTAFHSVQNALPKMAEGGRIILIGARPATDPEAAAALVAYSLSKGLVLQYRQCGRCRAQRTGGHHSAQHHRHPCQPGCHVGCRFQPVGEAGGNSRGSALRLF